jgi:4-amino-4-deoxy-L-arabinose transferase-like glycosyltransferase
VSERAWHEAADMKASTLSLALVVALAFALRVWHLGSGIPFAVGIDEPAIMTTVLRMMKSGDFNPHFFEYPTGYIYVQLGMAIVYFIFGAMRHWWSTVAAVGPSDFYLAGRLVTVVLGSATVVLVHQIGMRWGARHALLAAGLMAVMPMHVRESHFVLTDVPLTFCVALTFLLSLRAVEKPTLVAFVLAGAAAGLSAGVKYNGLMAVSMPLAAALLAGHGRHGAMGRALAAGTACIAAFFVTTPYAILALPAFLDGFANQARAFSSRQASAEPSWLVYLKHLRQAFGWPAALLAASGFVLSLLRAVKGPAHARWVLLILFPLVYFYLITGWSFLFARYALPLVPFIALWAAVATISGVSLLRRFNIPRFVRTTLIAGLTVAALLQSVSWVRGHGLKSTQALAWEWIDWAVWPGSRVISEARGLEIPTERYQVETVKSLLERDPTALIADRVQWVILSSDAWENWSAADRRKAAPPNAYGQLYASSYEAKVILPSEEHPGPEIHILRMSPR